MARRKEDILDRLWDCFSLRGLLLHQSTLVIVATCALIGGAIYLWDCNREAITQMPEYQLTEKKIFISPAPSWIDQDLKKIILERTEPNDSSILDTQLVSRTAQVMQSVGFVESVRSVEKSKNRLDIDLVYRTPVALVEISMTTIPRSAKSISRPAQEALVPVDRDGVLMPEEIADQIWLPRILIPFPAQHDDRTTWKKWPDQRVHDAAAICALFGDSAQSIGITWIVSERHPSVATTEKPPFELWPKQGQGTKVIWGNAPGHELEGEANSEQKMKALNDFIAAYGPLKNWTHKTIDVRSGTALPVVNSKTATNIQNVFLNLK